MPRGPLADLLAADAADAVAPAPDPVELFGWMLQLRGTVRVAALLDERPPPPRPPRPARPAGADDPLWRLQHIRVLALRPLRNPLSGRHAMAGAAAMRERLLAAGLLGRRRLAEVSAAADELGGPFHREIGTRIAMARAGTADLREQLAPWLQSLGPAAWWLEKADAEVREHTEERARQLFSRVPAALARRFADGLWQAVQALPGELPEPAASDAAAVPVTSDSDEPSDTEALPADSGAGADPIAAWYEPGGWIAEHLQLCRRAVAAACRHEARALEALVAAARDLAITENDHDL